MVQSPNTDLTKTEVKGRSGWEKTTTYQSGCNDEWTGCSTGPLLRGNEEVLVRAGDDKTDDEDTTDIEDQDTEERSSDSDRDIATGVLSLGGQALAKVMVQRRIDIPLPQ